MMPRKEFTVELFPNGQTFYAYDGELQKKNMAKTVGKYKVTYFDNGAEIWRHNEKLHREDGPAVEYKDGEKEWWLNNQSYREQEWKMNMREKKLKVLGIRKEQ